jgi:hypothetical protein
VFLLRFRSVFRPEAVVSFETSPPAVVVVASCSKATPSTFVEPVPVSVLVETSIVSAPAAAVSALAASTVADARVSTIPSAVAFVVTVEMTGLPTTLVTSPPLEAVSGSTLVTNVSVVVVSPTPVVCVSGVTAILDARAVWMSPAVVFVVGEAEVVDAEACVVCPAIPSENPLPDDGVPSVPVISESEVDKDSEAASIAVVSRAAFNDSAVVSVVGSTVAAVNAAVCL